MIKILDSSGSMIQNQKQLHFAYADSLIRKMVRIRKIKLIKSKIDKITFLP